MHLITFFGTLGKVFITFKLFYLLSILNFVLINSIFCIYEVAMYVILSLCLFFVFSYKEHECFPVTLLTEKAKLSKNIRDSGCVLYNECVPASFPFEPARRDIKMEPDMSPPTRWHMAPGSKAK